MILSINGVFMEEDQAVISVFDHGFLYGIGLFETFRTYDGIPFLFNRHLQRLSASCMELGIEYHPQPEMLMKTITNLLKVNDLPDGYIRLSVSAGAEPLGLPTGNYRHPNEIIYVKDLPERDEVMYERGKPLQLLQLRRNTPEGPLRMKSFQYMNNVLAKRELQHYPWAGGAEGLFLNASNHVAEGLVSNIFFVDRDRLCTPSLDTGILPGITRAFVLDLADKLKITYEQGFYNWQQLCSAEDIFITNSIQEIVPISCVYDQQGTVVWIRANAVQGITHRLMAAYRSSGGPL
jgi:4-amino-4-deoxychorismate lyase